MSRAGQNTLPTSAHGRAHPIPQHFDKLRIMPLQDPEKGGNFAVRVINDFSFGTAATPQKHAAHTHKGLGVEIMRRLGNERTDGL